MADEPEDDVLELDTPADEQDTEEQGEQQQEEQGQAPDEEEDIVFGDDPIEPQDNDSALIKHLRSELKRTRQELSQRPAPLAALPDDPGPEPDFEDPNAPWYLDPGPWKAAHKEWEEKVAARREAETAQDAANRKAQETFQADVQRFEQSRSSLKVAGGPEAIDTALSSLNEVQRAAIVRAADNAALVFAALGKHPARLQEITAMDDPVHIIKAVVQMEGKLKMTKRAAPAPETIVNGNASVNHAKGDKKLEALEKKAADTGDRTELIQYRKELRERERDRAKRA